MISQDEKTIMDLFESIGVAIKKIEEETTKTTDFIISIETEDSLIELKTKNENPQVVKEVNDSILKLGKSVRFGRITQSSKYSNITHEAVKQINSQAVKQKIDFSFIFLWAKDPNSSEKVQQYYWTIYGKKLATPLNSGNIPTKLCYFYSESDFYRYRKSLDGVFIFDNKGLLFCINPFSKHYNALVKSKTANKLKKYSIDPKHEEKNGNAYIMDCHIDRKKYEKLQKYFCKKYKFEAVAFMDLNSILSTFKI